jgi:hypothetical protein
LAVLPTGDNTRADFESVLLRLNRNGRYNSSRPEGTTKKDWKMTKKMIERRLQALELCSQRHALVSLTERLDFRRRIMKRACGSCPEYDRETNSLPERCLIFVKDCPQIVAAEDVECATLDLNDPLQKALWDHVKDGRLRLLARQAAKSGDTA